MRVAFLLLWSRKELWHFKVKESIHFVEQKYCLYQKRKGIENGKSHTVLERRNLCLSLKKNCKLKVKLRWVGVRERKKGIFVPFILSKGNFLRFVFYLSVQCIEYTFRIYILLHFKKYYFIHFCCLFLKKTKAFSVSLSHFNLIWSFFCQSVELYPFFSQIWSFSIVFCFIMHNRFILIKFVDLDDSWAKIGTILILLNK